MKRKSKKKMWPTVWKSDILTTELLELTLANKNGRNSKKNLFEQTKFKFLACTLFSLMKMCFIAKHISHLDEKKAYFLFSFSLFHSSSRTRLTSLWKQEDINKRFISNGEQLRLIGNTGKKMYLLGVIFLHLILQRCWYKSCMEHCGL